MRSSATGSRSQTRAGARGKFLPALEGLGVCVFVDFRDFRLGAPLVTEMARGVETCRYTVAVLSPAYLESHFTDLESVLAEHLGLERGEARLLMVDREPVTPRLG